MISGGFAGASNESARYFFYLDAAALRPKYQLIFRVSHKEFT